MDTEQTLFDLAPGDLHAHLEAWGEPGFRTDQVLGWAYRRLATSYDGMDNLPRTLRSRLATEIPFPAVTLREALEDRPSQTTKLLFGLADGQLVESVVLLNRDRPPTLCLSSQVGCPMACVFCATGTLGPVRNLSVAEILSQVHRSLVYLRDKGLPDAQPNLVFMGMGEPLVNRKALRAAVGALVDPRRFAIGQRRITVSTVGVEAGIRELARWPWRINLAFSLHHADDRLRRELIPRIRSPLAPLMDALAEYARLTRRLVTFEYVLLRDRNDRPEDARALVTLLGAFPHPSLVNLIPYNPVDGLDCSRSTRVATDRFAALLKQAGIKATLRRPQGTRIEAACGQLALKGYQESVPVPAPVPITMV